MKEKKCNIKEPSVKDCQNCEIFKHNPIKETLIILAIFAFIGIGGYFLHKSTEPQPKPKTTLSDSLEELRRLDEIYMDKLIGLRNNDSLKSIGELYEINCAKIDEMEGCE